MSSHMIKEQAIKKGLINVTVNRPPKDAWFEMRVYDLVDGSEVLSEDTEKHTASPIKLLL